MPLDNLEQLEATINRLLEKHEKTKRERVAAKKARTEGKRVAPFARPDSPVRTRARRTEGKIGQNHWSVHRFESYRLGAGRTDEKSAGRDDHGPEIHHQQRR